MLALGVALTGLWALVVPGGTEPALSAAVLLVHVDVVLAVGSWLPAVVRRVRRRPAGLRGSVS